MRIIGEYKEKIINCLHDVERKAIFHNKAGRFGHTKDAEEFYRELLNLFFGWDLKSLNTEKDPNYEGADLGDKIRKIAVQITSQKDAQKVHDSIVGFKKRCLKEGYEELYVFMYEGKGDFPKVDFSRTVDGAFTFNKSKHILDNSDLCAKLKDKEFASFINPIYEYLDKTVGLSYSGLDEPVEDLGIIGQIFDFIQKNRPKKSIGRDAILAASNMNLTPKINLNFSFEQKDRVTGLMLGTWDKKEIVKDFIERQIQEDELSVNELIFQIQDDFCEIRGSNTPVAKIEDIRLIKDLSLKYIPENRKKNPSYVANAEALIFYFFEFCYIGNKTFVPKETTLFD
jgi:hypothetical protein